MRRMHLGIFVSHSSPQAGGGFTFEETVLGAVAADPKFPYDVTVFHYGSARKSSSNRLRFVSLGGDRALMVGLYSFLRPLGDLWNKVARKIPGGREARYYGSRLELFAARAGVDVIWSLTPNSEPCRTLPYFVTVWDLEHRRQPYFPEMSEAGIWEGRENMLRTLCQRAAGVVTGTQEGKKQLQGFYGVHPERVTVIPFPVPSELLPGGGTAADRFKMSTPYLFYPAQFWPHKNHVRALLTLAALNRDATFSLAFVGSDKGRQASVKKIAADLGISDRVHFLGFVTREELAILYRDALALLFPSYGGPDNLPPLEAFSLGCPVIASRHAGSEEQLGDAALLVPADETAPWVEAVRSLAGDPALRERLVKRGREKIQGLDPSGYVAGMKTALRSFEERWQTWV